MGSERSEENIATVVGSRELLPTRLGDALRNEITEAIVEGRLKPGDALPSEAQIAASNGVSKQVVREAVRELASLGLVHIQQGKATRVRALSAAPLERFFEFAIRGSETGLSEAIELRRILEPSLARLAALWRTESDVEALKLIFGRLESAIGNVPRWIEADLDFHEAVATAAANRLARFQITGLRPIIREVMVSFNSRERRGRADWRATAERHARVLQAIEARDGDAARAAMTRHFEAAEQAIAELFPRTAEGRGGTPGARRGPRGVLPIREGGKG